MNDRRQSPTHNDYSLLPGEAVARELGSDADGGSTELEAVRLLAKFGQNELRAVSEMPAWRRALMQFQDSLVYLLLGAIVVALAAWLIEGREGWPVDAIVIALVVAANGILGFVQEAKAANAVAALAQMTAVTSSVLREGEHAISVDGKQVGFSSHPTAADIPWGYMGVDVVLECTGKFINHATLDGHLKRGAKRVILAAPVKEADVLNIVVGVSWFACIAIDSA